MILDDKIFNNQNFQNFTLVSTLYDTDIFDYSNQLLKFMAKDTNSAYYKFNMLAFGNRLSKD